MTEGLSEDVLVDTLHALLGRDMTTSAKVRSPMRRKMSLALALLVGLAGCTGDPAPGEPRATAPLTMPSQTQGKGAQARRPRSNPAATGSLHQRGRS